MSQSKSRPASLSGMDIFAPKGGAQPTAINDGENVTVDVPKAPVDAPKAEPRPARVPKKIPPSVLEGRVPPSAYYKSLTVKVDQVRYKSLQLLSVETGKSHQDLMVSGLDLLLKSHSRFQG